LDSASELALNTQLISSLSVRHIAGNSHSDAGGKRKFPILERENSSQNRGLEMRENNFNASFLFLNMQKTSANLYYLILISQDYLEE
jgi:hypothetical protein